MQIPSMQVLDSASPEDQGIRMPLVWDSSFTLSLPQHGPSTSTHISVG